MMKHRFAAITVSFFCLGVSLARAQYYYPPPPPPMYAPPPPYYDGPSFSFPANSGPYFRLGGGPSFYFDGTIKQYGTVRNASVSYDTGFALDAGMGYAFNKYISVGFDSGYYETWIHSVSSPRFSTGSAYIGNVPFMGEVTLSLPIPHTFIVPYISGAVGGSSSQFWANSSPGFGDNINGFVFGSAWDTVFAYSGSAGVRFKISPHFSAAIGYNYFATGDTSFDYGAPFGNLSLKGVQANTAMFTLQWKF